MARAAEFPWRAVARQTARDLQPFPGRLAMTWRVALLCAIVAGVAMVYKIPESAIGCYLIIFLMKPNGAQNVGQSIGLIILASVVVLAMAPLVQATADSPLLRIAVMALISFVFVFLGAASQLGEIGSIIALVIVFVLTLVDQVPAGEIVTRGLLYAWQMACVPMALMIVFNLVLGTSPHKLMRQTIVERLMASAEALDKADAGRVQPPLAEGNADIGQQAMLAKIFHTAPTAYVTWLRGAAMNSYRLMLAVAALPAEMTRDIREGLAQQLRAAADAVGKGDRPQATSQASATDAPALGALRTALAGLSQQNGGSDEAPAKPPFLAADAFTNPDYQRYALKTTAAAISCYLIYSLINWQGIHTAMITCYVAALGTTAETVHKLILRITGCLVGAAMGFLSILYIIPHLESVGGLMALVFAAILVAAWVSTGNERISYAGVQVGLAFLLTVLDGFAPSSSMDSGRDRIVGILLGNVVVYLFFTSIWPKSAVVEIRERLARVFAALSRLAKLAPDARIAALADAEIIETETAKAREQLALLPFEPASERPSAARIAELRDLIAETRAFLPMLLFATAPTNDVPRRLDRVAERIGGRSAAAMSSDQPAEATDDETGDIAARLRRIEQLAAG